MLRRAGWVCLVAWFIAAAVILAWPVPIDGPVVAPIHVWLEQGYARGLPRWLTYQSIEWLANVAFFLPLGVLLALLASPGLVRRTPRGLGAALLLALTVGAASSLIGEGAQALLLPERFASVGDLSANALGAVLGAVVGWACVSSRVASTAGASAP